MFFPLLPNQYFHRNSMYIYTDPMRNGRVRAKRVNQKINFWGHKVWIQNNKYLSSDLHLVTCLNKKLIAQGQFLFCMHRAPNIWSLSVPSMNKNQPWDHCIMVKRCLSWRKTICNYHILDLCQNPCYIHQTTIVQVPIHCMKSDAIRLKAKIHFTYGPSPPCSNPLHKDTQTMMHRTV